MTTTAELHLLKARIAELESTVEIIDRGISKKERRLRDEFAMAAIQNLGLAPKVAAKRAYEIADAMMDARNEKT